MLAGRIKLSAIPLFIVAGVLLGPHTPLGHSVVGGTRGIEVIAELGVILLLFFLGLEFSLERISQARRLVGVGGAIDLAINGTLGAIIGVALFGIGVEALLFGGLFYVSSSGIVTQALIDLERLGDDETDLTLGILVFEDLAIALFLGITAALATGTNVSPGGVALNGLLSVVFIGAFLAASRYASRPLEAVVDRLSPDQLFLFALSVAVGAAYVAERTHLSAAVGALLAGVLLSGTPIRDQIEHQLLGLRDFTAAVFFFAFGLTVDFASLPDIWIWIAVAIPAAVIGKTLTGYVAGRMVGFGKRQSLNSGASLVARGEFSVILAGMAATGAAVDGPFRQHIGPFAGIFVLGTAVVGVLFMRESKRLGRVAFPGAGPTRRRRQGAQSNG